MGIHEWSYTKSPSNGPRFKVPWANAEKAFASIKVEVELRFNLPTAFKEAERCLNCDVQTVFADKPCTECDACVDIYNGEEAGFAHATDGAGRQHRANAAGKRVGVRP